MIFVIIGKSGSGKDTIYAKLKDKMRTMETIVLYTTRPMREGEVNGREYHFVNEEVFNNAEKDSTLIEKRVYHTIYGDWYYGIIDDGILRNKNYLTINTLEGYTRMLNYFEGDVVPIYIEVDNKERLLRAIKREENNEDKLKELCRRFIKDSEDFCEDNLFEACIDKRFINNDLNQTVEDILNYILIRMCNS